MILPNVFNALVILSVAASGVLGACSTPRIRYECRELSDTARNNLFAAFKRMQDSGAYDKYVQVHVDVATYAHGTDMFLPWHRVMLRRFEIELGADLCYWDTGLDSQAPEASTMLMPQWFGGNSKGACLTDSYFSGYSFKGQCMTTSWDGSDTTVAAFYSEDVTLNQILSNNDYASFRTQYEGTNHARVHNGIGASFSAMVSIMNPLFFAHHANVDRNWRRWQLAHPAVANTYPSSTTTVINPYGDTVASTFDTLADPYCYKYSQETISAFGSAGNATTPAAAPSTATAAPAALWRARLARRSYAESAPEAPEADKADEANEQDEVAPAPKSSPHHRCKAKKHDANIHENDRSDLLSIRRVPPVPEYWIKMNNLDLDEIRSFEEIASTLTSKLNSIKGYVSPSALYNRPDLLEGIVKAGKVLKFYAGKGADALSFDRDNITSPADLVSTIRHKLSKAENLVASNYDHLQDDLCKAFGNNSTASAFIKSASSLVSTTYHALKNDTKLISGINHLVDSVTSAASNHSSSPSPAYPEASAAYPEVSAAYPEASSAPSAVTYGQISY